MKKRSNEKIGFIRYCLFCAATVTIAMFCISHSGCQITSEGIKVLDAAESPEITSVRTIDEKSLEVQFNKAVKAKTAIVSKLEAGERASLDQISNSAMEANASILNDGKSVVYEFAHETEVGERYQLFGEIADSRGNSLTFALPFDGYNSRVPILIIEEVQGAYSNTKNAHKCEYIILTALTDGNLGGLELHSAQYSSILSNYQIPPCEVKAGEKIMFHLRTFEDVDFANETDENLAKDKGEWSKSQVRDLFFENSKKCVGTNYDIILLRNKSNMKIMDALLYTTEEKKEKFSQLSKSAELAIKEGKWNSDSQGNYAPFTLKGDFSYSTRCLRRKNSDVLLKLAKEGKLSQDEICGAESDWFEDKTLYNIDRK
ncbi:MAG: hypothetical protein K2J68_00670 [Treponemataceae bacterium]|nr:hypothetical protein [Treponemataceae bacterium]